MEEAYRRSLVKSAQEQHRAQNLDGNLVIPFQFLHSAVIKSVLFTTWRAVHTRHGASSVFWVVCEPTSIFMPQILQEKRSVCVKYSMWFLLHGSWQTGCCCSICCSCPSQTVQCPDAWTGQALMKFMSGVRNGTVEVAYDNGPVLVAGVAFCKAARWVYYNPEPHQHGVKG